MGQVHSFAGTFSVQETEQHRAARRRVLMRASMRLRGQAGEWPLTVRDISSTGMKAVAQVSLFPGSRIEVKLPNIGWIPAVVARIEGESTIGIQFGMVIDPERTQVRVTGTYGAAPPVPATALRIL